jgi:serine/threonine-protein kinase
VGSVIQDRYKILAVVASGGMGVVYRGERLQLGRPVAIKFLNPWIAAQQSFLQRFEVEARAMSRLGHPNCVSVIDFGVADGPFLVMDFAAGRSLRSLLASERLAPARALGFARQILSGVAHAHAQGIIHRDLKPDNIIVSDAPGLVDHLRILDFGLAKLRDGPALTVGLTVGTPSYMAPEQTQAEGVIDARTDLYAVGILLFEMLTGRKPFVSDKVAELLVMQQSQPAPRLGAVASGVAFSDALEAVVAKALAKAPADRFANADEMAAALEQVPESKSTGHAAPAQVAPPAASVPESKPAGDVDQTITDPTLIDSSRHGGAPIWMRWLRPFWRKWGRRQWLLAGASAGAVLVVVLVWVLLRGHQKPDVAKAPPAAPAAAVAPASAAMDELSPMAPDGTPGLGDAAQLVRLGLREQAITILLDVRRDYPRSAYANFLLAVAYLEKLWWSDGLKHARAAIQLDPAYRRSPRLAKLFVHSLVSDSFWEKGGAFLVQEMAGIATPHLEETAQSDRNPRVRARAAQILARASASSPGQ